MNIIVDESNNLMQSGRGLVTGEIYFEEDGIFFPEKGWNDFPVIILGWWINNFLRFVKQNEKKFEFCFMDGPYKLVGTRLYDEMIEVSICTQYEGECEISYLENVDMEQVQELLLKASRKLFREVEKSIFQMKY